MSATARDTGSDLGTLLYALPGKGAGGGFGFLLDVAYMDLPKDIFTKMAAPMGRALSEMRALEQGAIANPDEHRMVGHYWLRDAERAPSEEIREEIRGTLRRIHQFAAEVHAGSVSSGAGPFRNLLTIGIGGSALGPELVAAALSGPGDRLHPFFLDNTDPDGIDRVIGQIQATAGGLAQTLVLVVSKSGGTKETRNGQFEVKEAFRRAGLDFASHFVAVTGDGSELHQTALAEKWRTLFPMWDWVGGRTSELSAVGLLPAALQGLDIDEMLRGAREMDALTRAQDPAKNPAAVLALCWHHAMTLGRRDMVILPYKDRLELVSRYMQQLVMESLGKELDLSGKVVNQGIAVYGNKGSTDQHAYVQQLRDGLNNFFVTFIEVQKDRALPPGGKDFFVEEQVTSGDYLLGFLLGTREALHQKGRLSLTLTVPDVSAHTLGMLIGLFERAVGLYGFLVEINAYHQPGVEAGKKAAVGVLALQGRLLAALSETPRTAAELAGQGEAYVAFKLLEHLSANGRVRRQIAAGAHPMEARYLR